MRTLYQNILDVQHAQEYHAGNTYAQGLANTVGNFFNSPEYQAKEMPTEAMVNKFYRSVLGRRPDASERAHYVCHFRTWQSLSLLVKSIKGGCRMEWRQIQYIGLRYNKIPHGTSVRTIWLLAPDFSGSEVPSLRKTEAPTYFWLVLNRWWSAAMRFGVIMRLIGGTRKNIREWCIHVSSREESGEGWWLLTSGNKRKLSPYCTSCLEGITTLSSIRMASWQSMWIPWLER